MGRRFPILGFGIWVALTATGCRENSDDDKYLVVSAVHYMKKYPASPDEEEEIRFTLNHGRTKIVAHCQAWDIENNCKLEVGKEYALVREGGSLDMLCLYDPQDRNQPRHAQTVLVVEEESVRKRFSW